VKTYHLLALLSLALSSACGPLTAPLAPAASAPRPSAPVAATSSPKPTVEPTLVAGPAPIVETCAPGESPLFVLGFAGLKERLGDRMGSAVTCERPGPEGDALQQTTTGMARYRKNTNIPSFTAGSEHWALTSRGLVHWFGAALDPPETAQVIDDDHMADVPLDEPAARPAPATATPYTAGISVSGDDNTEVIPGLPAWIQKPLVLLREYDRRNATVLVPAITRADISIGRLGGANGAWGLFAPGSHRIVLDSSLVNETPQAVAAVLGHEADHARDTFQYGPPRSDAACYTFEITAFALEARIWASFYGPLGKSDASTDLERELNLILETSRTKAGTLIGTIKDNYRSECEY